MIKLSLTQPYKIFKEFEVELPDFTIITGINGAGKSQLLEAMGIDMSTANIRVTIDGNQVLNPQLYSYDNTKAGGNQKQFKVDGFNSSYSGKDLSENIKTEYEKYFTDKRTGNTPLFFSIADRANKDINNEVIAQ